MKEMISKRIQHLSAWSLPVIAGIIWSGGIVHADTIRYSLEIQDRTPVSYNLNIPVRHEGNLVVEAEWDCNRILSFRLESPGSAHGKTRRSGPSPQTLEIAVTRPDLESGKPFLLAITSLPAGGEGKGLLRINRPDSPQVVQERIEAMKPPEPEIPVPPWWMTPAAPPNGSGPALSNLYAKVERFRSMVIPAPNQIAPDPCRWQTALLKSVAEEREDLASGDDGPAGATARFYRRIAGLVDRVDELRRSEDPLLAGPPPSGRTALNRWLQLRREWVKPLEHELDILMDMPEDGYVPELVDQEWPTRFVSCVMACERNFEERGRTGRNEATNQELASTTWPFIQAAADALEAVANLVGPGRSALDRSGTMVDNQTR